MPKIAKLALFSNDHLIVTLTIWHRSKFFMHFHFSLKLWEFLYTKFVLIV